MNKAEQEWQTADYFQTLQNKAYKAEESFEDFVQRIGEEYYPERGKEWVQRNAFALHFYGLRVAACKSCRGSCPFNGHQYYLRLQLKSGIAVPWAKLELCEKLSSRNSIKQSLPEEELFAGFDDAAAEALPEMGYNRFSTEKPARAGRAPSINQTELDF